jgi:hypothetical protein
VPVLLRNSKDQKVRKPKVRKDGKILLCPSEWGRCLQRRRIGADSLSLLWAWDSSGAAADASGTSSRKDSRRGNRQHTHLEQELQARSAVVETPFLLDFLFALQSSALLLLPSASALGKASRGSWSQNRNVFRVAQEGVMDTEWELETEPMPSSGVVTVRFAVSNIVSYHFPSPWPLVGVHSGKGFLPEACRIPVIARRRFTPDRKLLNLRGKISSL